MPRLSEPHSALPHECEVLVIGSGYGGAVAAARFAEVGRNVCVLERGREFQAGDYSRSPVADVRVSSTLADVGRQDALCHYTMGDGVLVGCGVGLGGGSLINSGISLRPEARVWQDPAWPEALRADLEAGRVERDFARAEATLASVTAPSNTGNDARLVGLRLAADALKQPSRLAPMTVSFEAGVNQHGVPVNRCAQCGECNAGCNHGAKGDLTTSYLAIARAHGARFFTQLEVTRIERRGDRWITWFVPVGAGREKFGDPALWIASDRVVLAAGSLGTTGILLRSAEAGLPLSTRVGHRFSANGNALGFSWGGREPGTLRSDGDTPSRDVGPGITAYIDARATPDVRDAMVIEDGLHPQWANPAVKWGSALAGLRRPASALASFLRPGASLDRSMSWLFMGHDGARGQVRLVGDRLTVELPRDEAHERRFAATLETLSEPLGATPIAGSTQITVHPLGGAGMGNSAEDGVIDHRGRPFARATGDTVHDGLYVLDGAAIPTSLGSNPTLTITALAERACRIAIAEEGWRKVAPTKSPPALPPTARRDHLQFSERMAGVLTTAGAELPCEVLLTITAPDVDAMAADPNHVAEVTGTAFAPGLADGPLRVTAGTFALFAEDPEAVNAVQMIYEFDLHAPDGRRWHLRGVKQVQGWTLLQGWPQTTRLTIEVTDAHGQEIGTGLLRVQPSDFVRQLASWRVKQARGAWDAMRATGRFVGMFTDGLRVAYGGALAPSRRGKTPTRRSLRLPEPEQVPVQAWDRADLWLTRYRGGSGVPVLLLHGYAATQAIFTNDTIDTCLTEALVEAGHDVWIGEWRGSGRLAASARPFTLDHVAERDIPALVARVLEVSGAQQIDVVAHCIGSRVALMSLAAGHLPARQVRSFLGLQVGLHWENTAGSWLRAHSRLPDLLQKIGVQSLRSDDRPTQGLHYSALDLALKALPVRREDRCASPTCRRNTAIWGQLFHHPNLRRDTHDTLHEQLQRTNLGGIAHLAAQMRTGHAVDVRGRDVYLSGLHRFTMPTRLLYSEENRAVAAGTSRRTTEALTALHGEGLHRWETIAGYGHLDPLVGKRAHLDVFPRIVGHLAEQDARAPRTQDDVLVRNVG